MSEEEPPIAPEDDQPEEQNDAPEASAETGDSEDAAAADDAGPGDDDSADAMSAEAPEESAEGEGSTDIGLQELDASQAPQAANGAGESGASGGGEDGLSRTASDLEAVFDIPVRVSAVLGKSQLQVSDLLALEEGAVIELDRKVGEAIDIFVNNRLVARGEVVLVDDRLGVTMTEIIKTE